MRGWISVCLIVGLPGVGATGALASESASAPRCRYVEYPGHNAWPVAEQQLAPAEPSAIRLCRYSGLNDQPTVHGHPRDVLLSSRLITDQKLISSLVQQWDELERPGPGAVACPNDQGRVVTALLSYPNGRHVTVATSYTGCEWASNGDVAGVYNRHLWHELVKLTPRQPGKPTW